MTSLCVQVLTEKSIRLGIELMLLSAHPYVFTHTHCIRGRSESSHTLSVSEPSPQRVQTSVNVCCLVIYNTIC